MKTKKLCIVVVVMAFASAVFAQTQRGYYDAPYTRYEANAGTITGSYTTAGPTYNQADIAFEASDRTAVNLQNGGAVEWNVNGNFNRLGIVIRYSIAGVTSHTDNRTAGVQVYVGGQLKTTLTLNTKYSWEDLKNNGNSNNGGISNTNWRMRFDEVRYRVDASYPSGTTVKLVSQSNDLWIDFVEVESVPEPKTAAQQGATRTFGGGDGLQTFVDGNGGQTIFIPEGTHNVARDLWLGTNNTKIVGAGMWYSQINFTRTESNAGGVHWAANSGLDLKDLYLTTDQNSRSNAYKGIWGTTTNATVENVWITHFECGAWLAKYGSETANVGQNLTFKHCRFRNNYADGINFCKGANNNVAEHCDFRNNGDDDMAIWPSNNQQCYNNTFRYNTAEFCWRAASCSLYGGYGNKWQYIIVKDNYEVGIRINGKFAGACFSDGAANEFSNIDVIGCGTPLNTYNSPEPAVDITTAGSCNDIRNIDFSCINIQNSKFDAIYFRKENGNQIRNISMNGITINGTNRYGQNENSGWGNAAGIRFVNSPAVSNVSFCGSFANVQGTNIVAPPSSGWSSATAGCISCTAGDVAVTDVNISDAFVSVNSNVTLTPLFTPSNATNKTVTFSIVDGGAYVQLVNAATGEFKGLTAGEATVRVTTADGGKTATAKITVTNCTATGAADLIVESISWTPANPAPGDHVVFTATVKNQGGTAVPAGSKFGVRFDIGAAIATGYVANSNTMVWADALKNGAGIPALLAPCATMDFVSNGGDSGVGYWTAGAAGTVDVRAYVDDDPALNGSVSESNETNNTLTVQVEVGATAGVSEITAGKTIVAYGGTVEIKGVEKGEVITVYNLLGAKAFSTRATTDPERISTLQQGIYIVVIEGTNVVQKLIVR